MRIDPLTSIFSFLSLKRPKQPSIQVRFVLSLAPAYKSCKMLEGVIKALWSVFLFRDLKGKCSSYLYSLTGLKVKMGKKAL